MLVDSDRQIPLAAFPALWEASRGRDGALGLRLSRDDPWFRKGLSLLIRAAVPVVFGVRVPDANVPFKIVRRSVWQNARELIPEEALAPSLMLAVFMRRRRLDVAEQPVPHRRRTCRAHSSRAIPVIGRPPTTAVCGRGTRIVLTGALTTLFGCSRSSRTTRDSGRSTGANRTYLPAT